MRPLLRTHIEVYVFRRRGRRVEFLALRRADGRSLPGAWQPVTGRALRGERALAAAAREVHEETGLIPRRWWALESMTVYFDAEKDATRLLPLFACEADARAAVRLSNEHDAFAWLPARAAGERYVWEAQRRGLEAVRREVLARPALADALDVTALVRQHAARSRPARRTRT